MNLLQFQAEMEKYFTATGEKVRNYIHDELAFSILSKLPLKCLKRFRCVRKSWTLLFENHHFMSTFCKNLISNHHYYYGDVSLLLQIGDRDLLSLSSDRYENMVKLDWPNPFQEEDPWFCILDSGSITGILCLYNRNNRNNERTVFWNPATKEFKVIPPSPLEAVPTYQGFGTVLHGFGYDHARDDYKLIRYLYYFLPSSRDFEDLGISLQDVPWGDISNDSFWEIYSLRSNSWKKLDINMYLGDIRCSFSGFDCVKSQRLYLDGRCHWWHLIDHPDAKRALASFDLVNEVFFTTLIPLDPPLDVDDIFSVFSRPLYLVALSGSIALILWDFGTPTFDIYVLGEVGVKESWTKLFTIGPLACIQRPIGVGSKGVFFIKEDGEIVWFNWNSQMTEDLGIKENTLNFSHVLLYKENFLLMGG